MERERVMVGIDAFGWDALGPRGSDERGDDGGADGNAIEWSAWGNVARRV